MKFLGKIDDESHLRQMLLVNDIPETGGYELLYKSVKNMLGGKVYLIKAKKRALQILEAG